MTAADELTNGPDDAFIVIGEVDPTSLTEDPNNMNLGTTEGDQLLDTSLEEYGAARSIVLDRNNVDIAGNRTLRRWLAKGGRVMVVETDGSVLVAVRRRDLDLAEDGGRAAGLGIADNRTGEAGLRWDVPRLVAHLNRPNAGAVRELWTARQREDLAAAAAPSRRTVSFEATVNTEATAKLKWPIIRVQVPPDTFARYLELMGMSRSGGVIDECDQLAEVLEWAYEHRS